MILHIPHSSSYIPPESRKVFVSQAGLEQELLAMTDLFTDELFDYPCARIVFPVSRLVCDVERFRDPADEMMTAKGMWVCYTKTSGGEDLKTLTDGHIADIMILHPHCLPWTDIPQSMKEAAEKEPPSSS